MSQQTIVLKDWEELEKSNLIIWWLIAKVFKNKLDVAVVFLLFVALGSTSSHFPRPRKNSVILKGSTKFQTFNNELMEPNHQTTNSESTNFVLRIFLIHDFFFNWQTHSWVLKMLEGVQALVVAQSTRLRETGWDTRPWLVPKSECPKVVLLRSAFCSSLNWKIGKFDF